MSSSSPFAKIISNISSGTLTVPLLQSALSIIKSQKFPVAEIQGISNKVADYMFFNKERGNPILRLEILKFQISILKQIFGISHEFDLKDVVINELEHTEKSLKKNTFSFSQLELFVVPILCSLDDFTKVDFETIQLTLTLSSMIMSSKL